MKNTLGMLMLIMTDNARDVNSRGISICLNDAVHVDDDLFIGMFILSLQSFINKTHTEMYIKHKMLSASKKAKAVTNNNAYEHISLATLDTRLKAPSNASTVFNILFIKKNKSIDSNISLDDGLVNTFRQTVKNVENFYTLYFKLLSFIIMHPLTTMKNSIISVNTSSAYDKTSVFDKSDLEILLDSWFNRIKHNFVYNI